MSVHENVLSLAFNLSDLFQVEYARVIKMLSLFIELFTIVTAIFLWVGSNLFYLLL